jgi:hypothetical protein
MARLLEHLLRNDILVPLRVLYWVYGRFEFQNETTTKILGFVIFFFKPVFIFLIKDVYGHEGFLIV